MSKKIFSFENYAEYEVGKLVPDRFFKKLYIR